MGDKVRHTHFRYAVTPQIQRLKLRERRKVRQSNICYAPAMTQIQRVQLCKRGKVRQSNTCNTGTPT
jgi:hypothetical protein